MSRCVTESLRTLPDGRTMVRCLVCGKERPFKRPESAHMECTVGPQTLEGPGRELEKLIREFGIERKCGDCAQMVARMNAWGVNVCREKRAEIVARLRRKIKDLTWTEKLTAAWSGLGQVPIIDPIGGLVDLAIERAAKLASRPCSARSDSASP